MNDLQKNVIKRKNNADLRISGDPATLAWLSEVFHCSETQAAVTLYDFTKTRKGGFEIAESESDANGFQGC